VKHWREPNDKSVVHCEGAIASGEFTLCGRALEGERGDEQMEITRDLIRCPDCEAIIAHCKIIKPSEINQFSRRRLKARRAASR